MTINSPEFSAAVNDDEGTIKWVVTQAGELYVIQKFIAGEEIPHTILTNGQPALAAGEAIVAGADGEFIGLEINRHSGHYQPGPESLDMGIRAFAEWGIMFAIIDREVPQ